MWLNHPKMVAPSHLTLLLHGRSERPIAQLSASKQLCGSASLVHANAGAAAGKREFQPKGKDAVLRKVESSSCA